MEEQCEYLVFFALLTVHDRHLQPKATSSKRMMMKSKKATERRARNEIRGPCVEIPIYRHHKDPRLRLCGLGEGTFPSPLKDVDVDVITKNRS